MLWMMETVLKRYQRVHQPVTYAIAAYCQSGWKTLTHIYIGYIYLNKDIIA